MARWIVVDLSNAKGELTIDSSKRLLRFEQDKTEKRGEWHLCDLNIVLLGARICVSSSTLLVLAKEGIVVLFSEWNGVPVGGLYPWGPTHSRIAARQRAQLNASLPLQKQTWKQLVVAKIKGQYANLCFIGHEDAASLLKELFTKVRAGDPGNVEAMAARIYWPAMMGAGFARSPGTQIDLANALLDYGYVILRGFVVRGVLSAGLLPALGVFHKGRANCFALADDFIEPFRPAIDFIVLQTLEAAASRPGIDSNQLRKQVAAEVVDSVFPEGVQMSAAARNLLQAYGILLEEGSGKLHVTHWDPRKIGCNA